MISTQPPSPKDTTPYKRRLLPVVNARFQWKYTLWVSGFGIILTTILGFFLYSAHVDNTRLLDLQSNPELQREVARGDQIFLVYIVILVVSLGLGLAFWGLIVTHRISGPLYLVARSLEKLASGQYPDLRPLRKHDELQDFFSVFTEAVTALRRRDVNTLKDLEGSLALAREQIKSGDAKVALDRAMQVLERYRDSLASALNRN